MHILFLTKWYPSKHDPQLGVFVQKHARAVGLSHSVTVVYIASDKADGKRFNIQCIQSGNVSELRVLIRQANSGLFFLNRFLNAMLYLYGFMKAWRKAVSMQGRPSVFHAHVLLRTALIGCMIRMIYGIPLVITEHWTGFVYGAFTKKGKVYNWLSSCVVRRADAITTVSTGLRNAMQKCGLHNDNFRVVPNVVESAVEDTEQPSLGHRKIILTVADLADRNKNISGSLRAMQQLENQRDDFEFHIIGGGDDEASLKELAARLYLRHTYFHGRQDNAFVLNFMNRAAFILTNSNVETFSVATAEALAAGKPVVATISGGPEDFVDERCGILIAAGDNEKLCHALNSMLDRYIDYDPVYMRRKMEAMFSAAAVGNALSGIYETIIQWRLVQ